MLVAAQKAQIRKIQAEASAVEAELEQAKSTKPNALRSAQ
jgi:hypothetical protein